MVDEGSNEFTLRSIDSEDYRSYIQGEIDALIENGSFAWALSEKRPIIMLSSDRQKFVVLHVMATVTRIRGMFAGLLRKGRQKMMNVSLSLLSIILHNSANATESYELYKRISEINSNLERIDNYRLFFEAAPDGVEVLDSLGNIIDCNISQTKLLCCSKEDLIGSRASDHFLERSMTPLTDNPSPLMENGYREGEAELVKARGDRIPVWRKEKAIYDKDNRIIGTVVYNRDITERRRAERALIASEQYVRNIIDSSLDMIITTDNDGRIVEFNRSAQAAFGYNREEVLGRHVNVLHADADTCEAIRREVLKKGNYVGEICNKRKNGELFTCFLSASTLLSKDDEVYGIVGVSRDITGSKRLETERLNLEERLHRAEKMEALGTLAGGVAHDLNNVLGLLVANSELLMIKIPQGNPLRKYAANILNSSEKGASIIDDLLTLARRGVSVSEVINFNGIVSDFLKTPVFEKLQTHHPRVAFRTELDADLLCIKGSPIHLEKTLMNLLANAAEAISERGEVVIRTENRYLDKAIQGYDEVREGTYAVLSISDSGKGIQAADRDKIFEPFYTRKIMGRSGTGLGLAVVWGTVKDHKGYIDVETEIGKGSTFSLYFPATEECPAVNLQKAPMEQYMGRGESILVVDDIADQREVATGLLTTLGYKVASVSSGEEAVDYLNDHSADLIILDMIMDPGIDGLETYRRILEIKPGQKAIIVSGFSQSDRVDAALILGAGAYVRKPYLMEKIGTAIRDELLKNQIRRRLQPDVRRPGPSE